MSKLDDRESIAGHGRVEAAKLDRRGAAELAARQRLRPILMTSVAFILGTLPLVIDTGPGSKMRHALGIAAFFGMIGVTLFGLLFTFKRLPLELRNGIIDRFTQVGD